MASKPQVDIFDSTLDSFRLYRKHLSSFFQFWTIPTLITVICGMMIIYFSDLAGRSSLSEFEYFLFLILFSILTFSVNTLFSGGIIAMTHEAMRGNTPSVKMAYDVMVKKGWRILLTGLVIGFMIGFGNILFFLGMLFCYWYIFAVCAVTLEGYTTIQAMDRCKNFSESQNVAWFIGILVVMIFVIFLVWFMVYYSLITYVRIDLPYLNIILLGFFFWISAPYIFVAIAYFYITGQDLNNRPFDALDPPIGGENPPLDQPAGRPDDY